MARLQKLGSMSPGESTFSPPGSPAGLSDENQRGGRGINNFLLWRLPMPNSISPRCSGRIFHREELAKAIAEYQRRRERFGGVRSVGKENK